MRNGVSFPQPLLGRRGSVQFTAIATAIALLLLVGCESEKNQPTAADFEQERAKLMARVEERKANKTSGAIQAPAPAEVVTVAATDDPIENSFAGGGGGFEYDSAGKTDPFRSFEWERLEITDPRGGPLEQFDVSQLSVVAVIWKTGNAKALIQDPSGQGYIVGMGTAVGKNEGLVTSIDDNLVVVKETYEDFLGNVTKKDIEMRIRASEGG
jgi:Tfp pilus assembly protein PilP